MWRLVIEISGSALPKGAEIKGEKGKDICSSRRNNIYVYKIGIARYDHFSLLVKSIVIAIASIILGIG